MAEKTMNEKEKYLDEIEDKIRTIGVLTSGGAVSYTHLTLPTT